MPIIRGNGPRDGFPDFTVKRLRRDKVGVLSGVCERRFEVGPKNQRVDPAWLDQGNAPQPGWGIPCVDADSEIRDGHVVVTYFFEGQEESYSFAENAVTYEFEPSEEDATIESHPFYESLKTLFGWDPDKRAFAEDLPSSTQTGSGYANGTGRKQKNPLLGVESWSSFAGVYRRTYTRRSVPASAWRGVNETIDKPPGIDRIGEDFSNRTFLKLAPQIVVRGNASQITENYLLAKAGFKEAAKIIYDGKGLRSSKRTGRGAGQGLSTGSL